MSNSLNFRHDEDGSYSYGYEAADGSFKLETCYSFFRIFWGDFLKKKIVIFLYNLIISDIMKMAPTPTVMKQPTALSSWKRATLTVGSKENTAMLTFTLVN